MTLEPDKTKEGMDYLYHIGNAILNSYLDIKKIQRKIGNSFPGGAKTP